MDTKDDEIHFIAECPKYKIQQLEDLGVDDMGENIINVPQDTALAPSLLHHLVLLCNKMAIKILK